MRILQPLFYLNTGLAVRVQRQDRRSASIEESCRGKAAAFVSYTGLFRNFNNAHRAGICRFTGTALQIGRHRREHCLGFFAAIHGEKLRTGTDTKAAADASAFVNCYAHCFSPPLIVFADSFV